MSDIPTLGQLAALAENHEELKSPLQRYGEGELSLEQALSVAVNELCAAYAYTRDRLDDERREVLVQLKRAEAATDTVDRTKMMLNDFEAFIKRERQETGV